MVYCFCDVRIEGRSLLADLVPLPMRDFDIIFSMDWLVTYLSSVHCYEEKVMFHTVGGNEFAFTGGKIPRTPEKENREEKVTAERKSGIGDFGTRGKGGRGGGQSSSSRRASPALFREQMLM
ncbi:hypothetical protein NE237_012750 [Protea cynaroides]|uniref:Uncharacterized protein n=1 Tax=Protea cynaroides TaxID=273540 RepID=A0A9Q0JYD3_9MAGN|nr:hypothetical protein NE237_012750 [Protea cynaroides]